MVPKKKRVTKELFQSLLKHGKSISGSFFIFRYDNHTTPHYAFVVPKNLAKKAVERNLLRRRGYAILRSFPIKTAAGIFFYKKEGKNAHREDMKKDIAYILAKARIL